MQIEEVGGGETRLMMTAGGQEAWPALIITRYCDQLSADLSESGYTSVQCTLHIQTSEKLAKPWIYPEADSLPGGQSEAMIGLWMG